MGARIRALRLERGITQEVLGGILGVTFQQVQKYESGANTPGLHRLKPLADALGTTPAFIAGYGFEGEQTSQLLGFLTELSAHPVGRGIAHKAHELIVHGEIDLLRAVDELLARYIDGCARK